MDTARIKPPMELDNAWWWEMAAKDKLGIQRCQKCHTLRHPPRPMCGDCHSLEWDAVEASGRGSICSYTVLRHPQFPGYEYPLIIVLVDLEEGTRVTSQLVGCDPEDVDFDLPVEMVIQQDEDGFKLPVFKLGGEYLMPITLKNETAIAGIGLTEFSKHSGVSELSLATQCVKSACDDAGIDPREIDGLVTYTLDSSDEIEVARAVGAGDLSFFSQINYGGGAAVGTIAQAAMAVATGQASTVVCYRAMNGRSGKRMGQGVSGHISSSDLIHWSWYTPYGMLIPGSWIAMIANKYMHQYGVTRDDLGRVAISQRNHALRNPRAYGYGKPLSMEEYLNAKQIAEPLCLYDFCQETDGGCAILVTSTERARDLKQKPAIVRAVTQASSRGQEQMTSFYRDELASLPEMELAAKRVYEMSGLRAKDIDAACLYDAFTSEIIMQLESFGFCGRGEGKFLVREGALDIDGRLPNNTHGGLISEGYIHGMNNIAEGVRLIRGDSSSQPTKDVAHVLVSSGVGVPTGAMILGQD